MYRDIQKLRLVAGAGPGPVDILSSPGLALLAA